MSVAGQMERNLPPGFEDLEPFVARWAGETTAERMVTRCEADMEDIQVFYDAMLSRGEDAMNLISQHPLTDLPPDVANLAKLLLALAQASIAVELHGQPRAPEAPYPNSIRLTRGPHPYG